MIDRETFAKISHHMGGVENFKLRQRRDQMPLLDDRQRRGRGFHEIEAYFTSLVEEFRNGFGELSLTFAASIVSDAIPGLRQKWPEIVAASNPGCGDVMIGRAVLPGGPPVPVVGTPVEICEGHLMSGGEVVSVIAISASRALAAFDQRCQIAGVELPADFDLWAEVG